MAVSSSITSLDIFACMRFVICFFSFVDYSWCEISFPFPGACNRSLNLSHPVPPRAGSTRGQLLLLHLPSTHPESVLSLPPSPTTIIHVSSARTTRFFRNLLPNLSHLRVSETCWRLGWLLRRDACSPAPLKAFVWDANFGFLFQHA